MNKEDKKVFADLLKRNAGVCSGIAMRVEAIRDRVGVETIETIHAVLAVAEAVRILAQIQMGAESLGQLEESIARDIARAVC